MTITIVTSNQIALANGEIVGGAPVVAKRQANALALLGINVCLLDINNSSLYKLEKWQLPNSTISVISIFDDFASDIPLSINSIYRAKTYLELVQEEFLMIQETLSGAMLVAAKQLGRNTIFQPNDYSFLCARSWFLKGDGTRCDMLPSPNKCNDCQVNGRSLSETLGLNFFALVEGLGIRKFPQIKTLQNKARRHAENIPSILNSVDYFIAQSSSMLSTLLLQGIRRQDILHINYGIEKFTSRYSHKVTTDIVIFSFIARPSFEKGLHLVLDAWSKLDKEVLSKAKLIIYSPINQASPYQRKRLELLLAACTNIEISNISVSQKLDEIYSNIDVALQPSLWIDHNTQTILEALCRSVPVIVPLHTSFANDLVFDGENGLLVDLNKESSLKNAISRLIMDRSLLNKLKENVGYRFYDSDWAEKLVEFLKCIKIHKMDTI